MSLDFKGARVLFLDLEMTLYFGRVTVGFFSLSPPFSHMRSLYL